MTVHVLNPGDTRSGCAGATRGTITLAVGSDGAITLTRSGGYGGSIARRFTGGLAVWCDGLQDFRFAGLAAGAVPDRTVMVSSTSGGGDYHAVVTGLPTIGIVGKAYGRGRSMRLYTCTAAGVTDAPLVAMVAAAAAAETL